MRHQTVLRVRECEDRLVPSAAINTAYEAYSWVLINTLRANPTAFANNVQGLVNGTVSTAFGFSSADPVVSDLKGFINRAVYPAHYAAALSLMRSTAPQGPLAWDETLEARAEIHNDWMKVNGFAHTGTTGHRTAIPGFTANDAAPADVWGYGLPTYTSLGENIGWAVGAARLAKAAYNTGSVTLAGLEQREAFLDALGYMLELDSSSLGHLSNLLGSLNVIALDIDPYEAPAAYEVQDGVPESWVSTQRLSFTRPGGVAGGFVSGVAFRDDNWNGFYDAGEAAALTVDIRNALGAGTTVNTDAEGAFSEYLPDGTYTVTFSSGGQTVGTRTVTVNGTNVWAGVQIGGMVPPTVTTPTGSSSALRPTVTWTTVDSATGYQVRLDDRTAGVTNLFPTAAATTGTSWAPPADLVSGHTYRVSVRAVRDTVTGPWGDPVDFMVAVPVRQSPAGPVADLRPDFTWSAIAGAARYEVRLDDLSAARTNIFPRTATTGPSWQPPADLVSGRTYRWRVRAVNANGLGVWSPAGTFTVSRPTQTGPATGIAQLRPTFTWTAVTGASGYEVRLRNVATAVTTKFQIPGTTWAPPTDLVSGRTYTWSVRAVNAQGLGAWSPAATVAIGRPTLSGPIGDTSSLRPTFTWTTVGGASSYQVRVDDATTGRVRLFVVTTAGLSWAPPSDLTAGHTYHWYVRALNAGGLGLWSPAGTFRVV